MQLQLLNSLHLEDIKNPIHPSIFFDANDYKILIYRLFNSNENELNITSHPFIIDNQNKIYQYNQQSNTLTQLENFQTFYQHLDQLVDEAMEKVEDHVLKVEDLEEDILDNKNNAIKGWFQLKKELTRMERVLTQAIKAHETFMSRYLTIELHGDIHTEFEDILEHLNRIYRNCGINLLKLESIYNLYTTMSNEKMNSTIYALTIISAIFLPLNLLVGFFGMNTQGLFFANNPNGTIIVTSILVSLIVIFIGFFKFKKNTF